MKGICKAVNNINELVEIIKELGQNADFESICVIYQRKHKIFLSQNHKIVIEKLLNNNYKIIEKDRTTGVYKIVKKEAEAKNNEDAEWLLPANPYVYDYISSFRANGYVEWRQNKILYSVGDIIYIYASKDTHRINVVAKVVKTNISKEDREINDDEYWCYPNKNDYSGKYFKIILINYLDDERLSYDMLKENGLNAAPQGPQRVKGKLLEYIHSIINVSNEKHVNYYGFDFESVQCKKSLEAVKTIINEFKEKYPLESIKDLSLDEFIFSPKGKGNDQSFCRMLRYDLQCACSMGNAWPTTFEIYKNGDGVVKLSPTFEKEFGTNYDGAFKEIKQRIALFLEAAKNKETEAMNSVKLNAQFKCKLAAVYFDDIYYPGAVREYLKQSCVRLGISFDENNIFNNMLEIVNWKNKHDEIKNIDNHTLMNYTDYLIRSDLSMSNVTIENNPYKR